MSLLSNLLPGLRDLRAPLAAGLLWMFVIYLALAPLPSDPEGVVGSVDDLRQELGPVAQAAALAFVAYILGSFAQGVASFVVQLLDRTIFGKARPSSSAGKVSGLFSQQHGLSPVIASAFSVVALDASREALSRLETRDVDLLGALATIDWTGPLVKSLPVRRIYRVDVKGIGSSDEAEHDVAAQLLRYEVERSKAAVGKEFGIGKDSFEETVLGSGASHAPWLAPFLSVLLRQRLREELEQMRTRLLVDQTELFAKVDRLRAESDFRAAVAPALTGLALVLIAKDEIGLALASVVVAIVLFFQGTSQSRQSDVALMESLRIGKASSPSLDQVKALGTDPWIRDFWRMKEGSPDLPTGASSISSAPQ